MIDAGRKNKVLLVAHPKTGNHWILFVVMNYYRILNFGATETATLKDIYNFAKLKGFTGEMYNGIIKDSDFLEGYPSLLRSEYSRYAFYDLDCFYNGFDKLIYMYRNPYDVMISQFYYLIRDPNRLELVKKISLKEISYFDDYVRANTLIYIAHVKYNIPHADLVLYYDDLQKDPSPFKILLEYLFGEVDEEIFQKTIEMSSLKSVHSMEMRVKVNDPKLLTRNGQSGQYKNIMKPELIQYIKEKWEEARLNGRF